MARYATEDLPVEKTEQGPGKTPLYYNNVGLFSDPFLEDRLPNIEKYYNNASTKFLNDYWNIDDFDAVRFNRAYQDIMDLWVKLDKDVPKFCANERQLQNRWIDKIFEYLGWTIELEETVSRHGTTNFPDYGLYKNFEDLSKSKDLTNKFKKAIAVADAKAWGINLDGKGFSNKNPSYQIINYLKQTDKTWGILTDGRYWRIYSVRSESKHTTFYEIDLIKILRAGDYERFKYFFNFFRVEAFEPQARLSDRCFLDFVFEDGQFYSQRVENNLQERVYKVVDTICKGFLESYKDPSEEDLNEVYEYSMYYLFKLMFVLNCESKGLLEVNKQDDYYEFSLRKKCMDIKEQYEEGKNWSNQPRTYNYVNDLFELLKHGDEKIGVHGFGDEPFEVGSDDFYFNHKMSDDNLNHALLELACDYDEEDNLQFIDYKILSPDHIGSLFEGLLEFNLVKKGKKVELLNTKGDRKSTGSYYTPEYLVDYIVEETLHSQVSGREPQDILNLKILDPSMGSGHFLLGVVKYIENCITDIQDTDKKVKGAIEFDQIRKAIVKNCVFGVDINPLATQLAKFSLWIYSSQKGDTLEPLYDQLITHNALLDNLDWSEDFESQISEGSVDAIVGNPPYIGEKGNKEIFHIVKENSLGERFYQGKMDYFYFFFHKTLDLLKPSGTAGIVSTNYFGTATGATKLRADLRERATLTKVINFNELKIFKGAQGQHNQVTFFYNGSDSKAKCDYYESSEKGFCNKDILNKLLNTRISNPSNLKLYSGNENLLTFGGSASEEAESILNKLLEGEKLADVCHVKTGIMGGCDYVTKSNLKYIDDKEASKKSIEMGQGVFVLDSDDDEVVLKALSKSKYLMPFYKNSDIEKFSTSSKNSKYIIFSSKEDDATKDKNVKAHLSKFRGILEGIRNINKESLDLWSVLRRGAQNKFVFESELKVVAPQRSKTNTFGLAKGQWYASADVYYMIPKENTLDIYFLLGLLNSNTYYFWLFNKGKRKGVNLELYNKPLSEVPILIPSKKDQSKIASISKKLVKDSNNSQLIDELNQLVYELYGFTKKEIKEIERLYSKNHKSSDDTSDEKVAA